MFCENCRERLIEGQQKKFCSRSCSVSHNNKGRIRNKRNTDNYCTCGARKRKVASLCRTCKPYSHTNRVKNREAYNEYHKISMADRYENRKQWATELLGGKCARCGVEESLEFDHIDPSTKEFTICARLAGVSKAKLGIELRKCQLLCNPCHKEKSLPEITEAAIRREAKKRAGVTDVG